MIPEWNYSQPMIFGRDQHIVHSRSISYWKDKSLSMRTPNGSRVIYVTGKNRSTIHRFKIHRFSLCVFFSLNLVFGMT